MLAELEVQIKAGNKNFLVNKVSSLVYKKSNSEFGKKC